MTRPPYALTNDHFLAFGAIIQQFARHEYLMQVLMSSIVEAPVTPVSMLTVELGYSAKRNALLSLIKAKPLPKKQAQKIVTFLARLQKRSGLRNAIAHHVWKEGSRPNSVRSLGLSIRRGEAAVLGNDEEYTIEKLFRIADELSRLFDQFLDFLDKEGFLASIPRKSKTDLMGAALSPSSS